MDELTELLTSSSGAVDGFQFTIPRSVLPWDSCQRLERFQSETGAGSILYVKSTEASPVEVYEDDAANSRRFLEAAMAGTGYGVDVVLDTFDDIDRGYFTRNGLVDRRFNPRISGEMLSGLALALGNQQWKAAPGDAEVLVDESSGRKLSLADVSRGQLS